MRGAAAIAAVLLIASSAGAQCLGDFDTDGTVEVNEIIVSVNNLLSDCNGTAPTPTVPPEGCPIDFADDHTVAETPECYYIGRWNQTCGDDALETRWLSDGIEPEGDPDVEPDIVVIELLGFEPEFLFFGAEATSPTTADLFTWFTTPEPEPGDLNDTSGDVTLSDAGRTLVIAPDDVPFRIITDETPCDFVRYQGAFTDLVVPTARRASMAQLSPAVLERLRAARAARAARPARPSFRRK